jgi:general stress protein YciG
VASCAKHRQADGTSQPRKETRAHAQGRAHEFSADEARNAGRKGGEVVGRDRAHMAAIGRAGGQARARNALAKAGRPFDPREKPLQNSLSGPSAFLSFCALQPSIRWNRATSRRRLRALRKATTVARESPKVG